MAKARRDKGTGALYRRGDGLWVGAVDLGWTPDGRRDRRTVSSRNKAIASRKLRELRAHVDLTGSAPAPGMTVEVWLSRWLDDLRVRPMTERSYRETSRLYLVPFLGRRRLDQLAPQHVRELLRWIESPKPKGLGLSPSTTHRAHRVLRVALNAALVDGLVTRNVAQLVKPPSLAGRQAVALSAEQAKTLLRSLAPDDALAARWAVALLLGLRQGEALGLEWGRIDLDAGTIDLSWQLQRLGYRHGCSPSCGKARAGSCPARQLDVPPGFQHRPVRGSLCLTRPKSEAGTRVVPLPPMVLAALWAHHEAFGTTDEGLVFTRDDGGPLDPSRDNAAWHAALERAGLPSVKLHAARHTTGTLLLELGVPEHVSQAILGHSSAAVTRGYQHVGLDLKRAAMGRLGELLHLEKPGEGQ